MQFRLKSQISCLVAVAVVLAAAVSTARAQGPLPPPRFDESKAIPYRIARSDILAVAVFGEPDLTSGNHRVDAARGTVSLQLIKEIRLVGLTIPEAQAAIENAYKDGRFLRDPQVTVTIEQYAARRVMISGKVVSPGQHEIPPDQQMTIRDLIFKAGGFQDTARGREVKVTRTMPDGSFKTFTLDVQSAILGKERSTTGDAAFVLEPDDVVYVPEKII